MDGWMDGTLLRLLETNELVFSRELSAIIEWDFARLGRKAGVGGYFACTSHYVLLPTLLFLARGVAWDGVRLHGLERGGGDLQWKIRQMKMNKKPFITIHTQSATSLPFLIFHMCRDRNL